MGCCISRQDGGETFITRNCVTLYSYDDPLQPVPHCVQEKQEVRVLDRETKWWKVKHGKFTGFASKYYFAPKNNTKAYEAEPWFFGDLSRSEADGMLSKQSNPHGAFLVRDSPIRGTQVLDIKFLNLENRTFENKHYDVKSEQQEFWFNPEHKFSCIEDLISYCIRNKEERLPTKLGNICLIPNPHSDPQFQYYCENQDSWIVPLEEVTFNRNEPLDEGTFGIVYKGLFRGSLPVAVKKLKNDSNEINEKKVKEFFSETETMKRLNHPNLVQLYALVQDKREGNLIIQEFVTKGSLKNYLKQIDTNECELNQLARWCTDVCRGMDHLEHMGIVHRDLAARNILVDQHDRAKVADFGLALCLKDDQSGGADPYPGVRNQDYKDSIKSELRYCDREDYEEYEWLRCPVPEWKDNQDRQRINELYDWMMKCWSIQPKKRPSFEQLKEELEGYYHFYY